MADENNQNPIFGNIADEEPWALEETQEKILKNIESFIKNNAKKDTKSLSEIQDNVKELVEKANIAEKITTEHLKLVKEEIRTESSQRKEILDATEKGNARREKNLKDIKESVAKSNLRGDRQGGGVFESLGEYAGQFTGKLGAAAKGLLSFDGSLASLSASAGALGFGAGAAVAALANMTDTYQGLISVGQTFGGSLLEMSIQAGKAGLTLDMFAKAIRENSQVVAFNSKTLGAGINFFIQTQKEVRGIIRSFGDFGLKLEEITEFTGTYLDQLRLQGRLQRLNQQQLSLATANYLKQLTDLARITGKSREQLSKELSDAAQDIEAFSVAYQFEGEAREKYLQGVESMNRNLTSLLPEQADAIRNMTAAYVNEFDVLERTELGAALASMVPRVYDSVTKLGASLSQGGEVAGKAASELIGVLQSLTKEELDAIRLRARHGDEQAKQVLEMARQAAAIRVDAEQELAASTGEAAERLLDGTSETATKFDNATTSLLTFEDRMSETMGDLRAILVQGFESAIENLITHTDSLAEGFRDIVSDNKEFLTEIAAKVNSAGNTLTEDLGTMALATGAVVGGFIAFKAALGAGVRMIGSGLGKLFSGAGKAGGHAAAGIGAKSLAKSLLKKIPGLGLLAGLGFAAGRLWEGDIAGAGLEAASGAASTLPGIGTAASLGIDASLAARDYMRESDVPRTPITGVRVPDETQSPEISVPTGTKETTDRMQRDDQAVIRRLLEDNNRLLSDISSSNNATAKNTRRKPSMTDDLGYVGG